MTSKKTRHKPQRTCVGCRTVQEKHTLIRMVRTKEEGVQIDLHGKKSGRGAYLHYLPECWEKGLNGSLEKALKTNISPENNKELLLFWENIKSK